jgi:LysR family hydrogen peroxide-inducible transcriptional activator
MAVETRSASVSVGRFGDPKPQRVVGMVWRKTSPLAKQLSQVAELVRFSAESLRAQHGALR